MGVLDTHDIELAFYDLMQELSKIKDLNNITSSYKDNLDNYSKAINDLLKLVQDCTKKDSENILLVCRKYAEYERVAENLKSEVCKDISDFKAQSFSNYQGNKTLFDDHIARMNSLKDELKDETAALPGILYSNTQAMKSKFEEQTTVLTEVCDRQVKALSSTCERIQQDIAGKIEAFCQANKKMNDEMEVRFRRMSKRNNIISIIIASASICIYVGLTILVLSQ